MSFLDDWKEWGTAKKAISIIVVCCVGLIIIGMIGGGMSPDQNTSGTDDGASDDTAADTPTGKQVKITYDGSWSGALVQDSSSKTISGTGDEVIDIEDDVSIISANAQKQDSNSDVLTIQILKDGQVVEEAETDAVYGVASVAATVY